MLPLLEILWLASSHVASSTMPRSGFDNIVLKLSSIIYDVPHLLLRTSRLSRMFIAASSFAR